MDNIAFWVSIGCLVINVFLLGVTIYRSRRP